MTLDDFLALGFEVSKQAAFNEPLATEPNYYHQMTFSSSQENVAVRRKNVFAVRGTLQHRETLETSEALQFLQRAGGLHIVAGSVFIAAYEFQAGIESVTSGLLNSGELAGTAVIAYPSGFLGGGRLFQGGGIVPVVVSGALSTMSDELRENLRLRQRYTSCQ